jgi:predicted chitinase
VCAALHEQGILSDLVEVGVAATVLTEVGPRFQPIRERGDEAYFIAHYWQNEHVRRMLGNQSPEDAVRYRGRGWIQLTGRDNYATYGTKLGLDLLGDPDQALKPEAAARILARFFRRSGAAKHAERQDWRGVRKAINGGFNGWDTFDKAVCSLLEVISA